MGWSGNLNLPPVAKSANYIEVFHRKHAPSIVCDEVETTFVLVDASVCSLLQNKKNTSATL